VRRLIVALLAFTILWPLTSDAQWSPNRLSGVRLAQELLMRLANPRNTDYRVGIFNTAAEFGVLISPKEASARVEYFRGYSTERGSIWQLSSTARELLDSAADDLRLEVVRTTTDIQDCPELEAAKARLYAELEQALQDPISLSDIPQEPRPRIVTVDGTSYVLQIWTGARALVIHPDRDIDLALDGASRALLSMVSGCAARSRGTIEEHQVW
jgi:hypothetical protein